MLNCSFSQEALYCNCFLIAKYESYKGQMIEIRLQLKATILSFNSSTVAQCAIMFSQRS